MARIQVKDGELSGCDIGDAGRILQRYAPAQATAAMGFSVAVYQNTQLPLRVVEGARHRTAQINGCQTCQTFRAARDMDAGLSANDVGAGASFVNRGDPPADEAFYEAVADWKSSPIFSDRERLAIEFAERMGADPRGFDEDEAFWARLHAAFTDSEIVDLTLAVASWIGMGRTYHILGIDPAICPVVPMKTQVV